MSILVNSVRGENTFLTLAIQWLNLISLVVGSDAEAWGFLLFISIFGQCSVDVDVLTFPGTFLSCLGSCFPIIALLSLLEVGMASHQLQSVPGPLALCSIPFTLFYLGYPCPGYHLSVSLIHNTHPATAFGYVIAQTSKDLFHWQCLHNFHWNLRDYLLPQVLQNWLLWLSWFLIICRAATAWICVGILSRRVSNCEQLFVSNSLHEQCHGSRSATLEHTTLIAPSASSWEPHIMSHIFLENR